MADCGVCLVNDNFDQPPPPEKCFLGNAYYVQAHLVFGPNELVAYAKMWVHPGVTQDFHKDWVFVVTLAY